MAVAIIVAEIDRELRSRGTPERAEQERRYLKSELEHYGVTVPAIRSVAKAVRRQHADLGHDDLVALATALWAAPVHERRMATVELLDLYADRLRPADLKLLERLLRESKTWALVDSLAASVVGPLIEHHPKSAAVLDRWATDDDIWIRRSALLALLIALRRGEGDFERFSRYADAMLDEKEFFIRKAIGWVLRETSKKQPERVRKYVASRLERMSGVTFREAVRRLPEAERDELTRAYRTAR